MNLNILALKLLWLGQLSILPKIHKLGLLDLNPFFEELLALK